MAKFSVDDRVRVTDQHSEHRGMFGTVIEDLGTTSREGQVYGVRLDGHPVANQTRIPEASLQESTQPCPIQYAS